MVICLQRDADLHMAQLMPLPLTVSCFSKIQIGFTFLVPAYPGSTGERAVKRECVCVCYLHHNITESTVTLWSPWFFYAASWNAIPPLLRDPDLSLSDFRVMLKAACFADSSGFYQQSKLGHWQI